MLIDSSQFPFVLLPCALFALKVKRGTTKSQRITKGQMEMNRLKAKETKKKILHTDNAVWTSSCAVSKNCPRPLIWSCTLITCHIVSNCSTSGLSFTWSSYIVLRGLQRPDNMFSHICVPVSDMALPSFMFMVTYDSTKMVFYCPCIFTCLSGTPETLRVPGH